MDKKTRSTGDTVTESGWWVIQRSPEEKVLPEKEAPKPETTAEKTNADPEKGGETTLTGIFQNMKLF